MPLTEVSINHRNSEKLIYTITGKERWKRFQFYFLAHEIVMAEIVRYRKHDSGQFEFSILDFNAIANEWAVWSGIAFTDLSKINCSQHAFRREVVHAHFGLKKAQSLANKAEKTKKPFPVAPVAQALTVAGRRYLLHPDGTATDTETGLMWMRCSLGQTWDGTTCQGEAKKMTWHEAMKQTGDGFAGYSDWRLPTKEELLTLVYCSSGKPKTWNETGRGCEGDYQRPTIASAVFPNTPKHWFWSSSPYAYNSNGAWLVTFGHGYVYYYHKDSDTHVRLVRGGQ